MKKLKDIVRWEHTNKGLYFFPDMTPENILDYYWHPKGMNCDKEKNNYYWIPFTHVNIDPAGDVQSCVDFHDLTLGNAKQSNILQIFTGSCAELLRNQVVAGHNPACKHCPWRFNTSL